MITSITLAEQSKSFLMILWFQVSHSHVLIIVESRDQQQTLIYCYGILSEFLHLQRIPTYVFSENKQVKMVAMGDAHMVMALASNVLLGVGSNEFGQLGIPMRVDVVETLSIIESSKIVSKKKDAKFNDVILPSQTSQQEIEQLVAGQNHTVIVTRCLKRSTRTIFAFGNEVGVGLDGVSHTSEFQEIKIPKLGFQNEGLRFVYSKYNSTLAVDTHNRVFIWGEDSNGLRLRKSKVFYSFPGEVKQIALGKRHGVALIEKEGIYGWGDGTYGELGTQENLPIESPTKLSFFSGIQIAQIAAGARHTLVLDQEGNIFAMGDNSEDQCAIVGRRANIPEKILKEFKATKIFAGEQHNVALSDENKLYSWGGSTINKSWIKQKSNESKLRLMEDLNLRKVSLIDLSYSNTLIITGQSQL